MVPAEPTYEPWQYRFMQQIARLNKTWRQHLRVRPCSSVPDRPSAWGCSGHRDVKRASWPARQCVVGRHRLQRARSDACEALEGVSIARSPSRNSSCKPPIPHRMRAHALRGRRFEEARLALDDARALHPLAHRRAGIHRCLYLDHSGAFPRLCRTGVGGHSPLRGPPDLEVGVAQMGGLR